MTTESTFEQVRSRIGNDLAKHEVTCLRSDGLYRHYRCNEPGTYVHGFDIVTWPGYLSFVGDMGDYVFKRTDDMIAFMRRSAMSFEYAEEKCVASGREGIKEFSKRRFEDRLRELIEDFEGDDSERDELLQKIGELRYEVGDGDEYECYEAMSDSGLWDGCDFPRCEEYTYHFLWALHAIKWFCDRINTHCESLDSAVDKIVRCTDGNPRRLLGFNRNLGYYEVPTAGGQWMKLSGTYLSECKKLFIGGEFIREDQA